MVSVLVLISTADASARVRRHAARAVRKPSAQQSVLPAVARIPYIGAVVVDATNGRVLFDDNADGAGYPASVVKLMDMLIIMEKVRQGGLKLSDRVVVSPEAARVGGSQVYLKPNEIFSVDDLLYALMVKSANDAAVALAVHIAGSQEAFVRLMNTRAQQLGMTSTRFNSVHGLPPARGLSHDESTARDLALLACAVLRYPEALRYTATKHYGFRNGTFSMVNHNHLLGVVEGCDGLKTGYFAKAGYSIVATAQRDNMRVVAVVLGSRSRRWRDFNARELLTNGFTALSRPPVAASPETTGKHAMSKPSALPPSGGGLRLSQANRVESPISQERNGVSLIRLLLREAEGNALAAEFN